MSIRTRPQAAGEPRRWLRRGWRRAKTVLANVARHAERRGWWPSSTELARFIGDVHPRVMLNDLAALRASGLVLLEGRSVGSRWVLTEAGFDRLQIAPFVPRFAMRQTANARKKRKAATRARKTRARAAAVRVLDAGANARALEVIE